MTRILEGIHGSLEFGPFSLDQVLTFFYVNSSGEHHIIYKQSNKPCIYQLPNKTPYLEELEAYEISGHYTTMGRPLAFTGCNTNGNDSCMLFLNV